MKKKLTLRDKILLFPIWLITFLPLPVLYIFSDFLCVILYYVVRYRRSVVNDNLRNSFPEWTQEEIEKITKKFYRYLCDYFIESIYQLNMSAAECNKRYRYRNPDTVRKFYQAGANIIFATSHYGNWEWFANATEVMSYPILGIYKRLTNELFDKLFIHIRARYGNIPVPMKKTLRVMNEYLKKNELFSLYLIGDQRPPVEDLHYWTIFLNQDTPVLSGIDRIAHKYNLPVFFIDIERPKRGYYDITFKVLSASPKDEPQYAITEKYIRELERMILRKPELWLWSHKRWKYSAEKYKPKSAV